jgi:hypothetical protein
MVCDLAILGLLLNRLHPARLAKIIERIKIRNIIPTPKSLYVSIDYAQDFAAIAAELLF